jgi:hypothetical protein
MGDEDYGDEGEYEDYSGYGEGYDSSVMDPNMTGGVDGNKGRIYVYFCGVKCISTKGGF